MKLRFLTPAREELAAVLAHYDDENPERGNRFLDAVEQALEHIREWPQAWQKLSANTRRCLLHRFPYGLIYAVEKDEIIIIAIAHLHRKPGYWRDRWEKEGE